MKKLLPTEVLDEDDLLQHIFKNWHFGNFGKVYRISTFNISPDIDLLDIQKQNNTVIGYEFKIIKYHKGWKRPNITPLFTAIGQALSYFQFGVDQSNVMLGLSSDIPKEMILELDQKISELVTILNHFKQYVKNIKSQPFIVGTRLDFTGTISHLETGIGCLGMYIWDGHSDSISCKIKAEEGFPIGMNKNLIHWHNCLLREEFKCKLKI